MSERAAIDALSPHLVRLGEALDQTLKLEGGDAMLNAKTWKQELGGTLPKKGAGIDGTLKLMEQQLIPNGSQIPNPGCTSFITTGATSVGVLSALSGMVASPQRLGLTAFSYLEDLSLYWLAQLFGLPTGMQGVYSSGGSTANILDLGAARQAAFERIGHDVSRDGVNRACRIYVSDAGHRSIQRACAVLGLGRSAVTVIATDESGQIDLKQLVSQLKQDANESVLPMAIVANAGATDSGVIDPISEMVEIADQFQSWLHVDGAYGLPGLLDPKFAPQYHDLDKVDSLIVDPHKWLGAPVGIGATFVQDGDLLKRAFEQGRADYLEGSFLNEDAIRQIPQNSMDSLGVPYSDYGVELSAPSRGAVVWALLKEIGKDGLRTRVCRHNAMAQYVGERAKNEPELELLMEPSLSICCFRYVDSQSKDLNQLNRMIHRQLVHNGTNIPSTTMVNGQLAIRPCFIGARTDWQHAENLVEEVLEVGRSIAQQLRNEDQRKANTQTQSKPQA